jgi:molybdate transport system substrate-binding protein
VRGLSILFLIILLSCSSLDAQDIYCHAAASLADVLSELGEVFQKETGTKARFNFGASSLLARQLEEGAPGDLFVSADEAQMNRLHRQGLILEQTKKAFLSNTLVIVVSNQSKINLRSAQDLRKLRGRIATAEHQIVPAGIYAREFLIQQGLWRELSNRIVPVQNVRAALAAVESGNVEAGIVYKTDARISSRVRIAYEVPRSEGPEILYTIAILKRTKQLAAAKRFYDHLLSPSGLQIFENFGFLRK